MKINISYILELYEQLYWIVLLYGWHMKKYIYA